LSNLILIKHSLPEVIHSLPAHQWHLSEIGRLRCKSLAEKIMDHSPDVIFTSPEPKAIETTQIIADSLGKKFHEIGELREHERSNVKWLNKEDFEERVNEFFRFPETLTFGNETAHQANQRFSNVISKITEEHPAGNIAIVSHGTVIALWLAHRVGIDPFHMWKQLTMPSFVVVPLPQADSLIAIENEFSVH
jgi:broad specificity phosphatase PhoE